MAQMTVKDLRDSLSDKDDDLPVFFRRVAPIAGNIEEAGMCKKDTVSFFGVIEECVIIEPMK